MATELTDVLLVYDETVRPDPADEIVDAEVADESDDAELGREIGERDMAGQGEWMLLRPSMPMQRLWEDRKDKRGRMAK